MGARSSARAREGQGQDIASTLAKLELSEGVGDAESAAQQAVENMEDSEDGATPGIVVPAPRDEEEAGGDDDGGEEEASAGTPLPPAVPAPLVPAPKVVRAEKPKRGGSPNNKLGILAKMAPGATKLKVFKRRSTGELDFVRDYNAQDVNRFSDYESFIKRYLEPEYGPGEYELFGVDDRNNESALGTIRLIEPPKHSAETGVVKLVESVLSRSEELNRQAMERLERGLKDAQSGQQNPLELMRGVMDMTEALEQKAGGGKQDMFALMMAQQQQTTQLLVSVLGQKHEDPVLKTLLAKLLEEKVGGSSGGALPPPPPPPPASFFEKIDIAAALGGVAAIVTALGALGFGKKEKDNTETQLLLKLMEIQNADKLGPKDLISLLKNNEAPASDSFTDTVDKIAALLNVAKNLDPGGSPQNGIMDVLAALASNRDLGAGISRLLGAKLGGAQPQATSAQPPDLQKIQTFQQNLIRARDALVVERKKLEEEKKAFAAQLSGQRGGVMETSEASQATEEAPSPTSAGPAEAKNNAEGPLQLPPQTREFLDLISAAPDEAQRAKALVDFLLYFQTDPQMQPFAEDVMRNIREGNSAKALRNLHKLFNMFVNESFISVETAGATLKLLNSHAEDFQKVFADVQLESDREVTRESLLAPSMPASV